MMDGPPVVARPEFDILLSDVKNERKEGEEGVVTLGEIAADLGFENRCAISDQGAAKIAEGKLEGIIRGRYQRAFVPCTIKLRRRQIKTVFLVDTGGVNTFVGKPTWDKLFEGVEDLGNQTAKVTFCGIPFEEITMSPQDSHFHDIDFLGTDFMKRVNAKLNVDYENGTCKLEWQIP
mmetsp:Transcript_14868/g.41073  ORF Transcript_14868/g.41073 Transcript_14868/m.41073 type:complete len:177 (+) Transcript_14868:218-748(+)